MEAQQLVIIERPREFAGQFGYILAIYEDQMVHVKFADIGTSAMFHISELRKL